jgi:hypothetical protein
MKRNLFNEVFVAAVAATLFTVGMAVSAQESARTTDWREDYAYTLGTQAYIFGFPYVYLPSARWNWVTQPKQPGDITPHAPLNHFYNSRTLTDATYRGGGAPNQDRLYSVAWVDVSKEPVILSHPDMGDRYFTFELASWTRTASRMSASAQRVEVPGASPSSGLTGKESCPMA